MGWVADASHNSGKRATLNSGQTFRARDLETHIRYITKHCVSLSLLSPMNLSVVRLRKMGIGVTRRTCWEIVKRNWFENCNTIGLHLLVAVCRFVVILFCSFPTVQSTVESNTWTIWQRQHSFQSNSFWLRWESLRFVCERERANECNSFSTLLTHSLSECYLFFLGSLFCFPHLPQCQNVHTQIYMWTVESMENVMHSAVGRKNVRST